MASTSDQLGKQAKEVTEDLREMGETLRTLPAKSSGKWAPGPRSAVSRARKSPRRHMRLRAIRPAKAADGRIARGRRRSAVGLRLESGERPFPQRRRQVTGKRCVRAVAAELSELSPGDLPSHRGMVRTDREAVARRFALERERGSRVACHRHDFRKSVKIALEGVVRSDPGGE